MSVATLRRVGRWSRPSTNREKRCFPLPEPPGRLGGPTQPPFQWVPETLVGVRRLGCESGHLSPSSAKVQNGWSYTSTLPAYLLGVYRDITFLSVLNVYEMNLERHAFWEYRHSRSIFWGLKGFTVWARICTEMNKLWIPLANPSQ